MKTFIKIILIGVILCVGVNSVPQGTNSYYYYHYYYFRLCAITLRFFKLQKKKKIYSYIDECIVIRRFIIIIINAINFRYER